MCPGNVVVGRLVRKRVPYEPYRVKKGWRWKVESGGWRQVSGGQGGRKLPAEPPREMRRKQSLLNNMGKVLARDRF